MSRFEITGLLGKGGFGAVYRARFHGEGNFSKDVALKVLRPDRELSEDVARRLRDEARLLGLLKHRAIVQVDRLMEVGGRWVVVLEYVEGFDLLQALQPGPLGPGATFEVVAEVAGALGAAWSRQVDGQPLRLMHRDLKPGNIRITPYGDVKVLDFGIAHAQFEAREALTQGINMGSPGYMAPERFSLEDHHEGDVYSLGIVAWECLMRRRFGRVSPRQGKHDVQIAGALQQLAATPGLPPDGMQLIRECLRFDPKERPSARDVERRARAVARQAGGELLADWAERIAPLALKPLAAVGPDEDAILHDPTGTIQLGDLGMTVFEAAPPTPQPTSTPTWVAGLWAGALALMVLTLVGVGGLVDALRPESPAAQAPTQEPEALGVIVEPEVIAEPASVDTPTTRSRPSRAQTRPPAVAPKPLVEAEPEVQTEPEVEAATEPAPNPALRPTRVLASGDAVWIRLVRNGQLHAVPATLPAGTYEVMARFPEQEPEGYMTVQLEGQGQVVIHCTSAFRTCQLN